MELKLDLHVHGELSPDSLLTIEQTAALCRERGYKNVLLLTSALHMPRSMQFFERYLGGQGIKVGAYPCDYTLNPKGQFNPRWLVPQLQAFDITCMALHEYVGMAGAFLQR